MPEVDVSCSKQAFEHFADRNFEKARSVLDGLKNENVKIKHNALLARYFQQCLSADELLIELSQLLKPHMFSESTKANSKQQEDVHVLRYNTALLLVQLQHYLSAVTLLEEGFARIEPIDDFLAIKISFLLIEAYLRLKEPYRAMDVISYLEKPNSFITVLGRKEHPSPLSQPTLAAAEEHAQDLDIVDDGVFKQEVDHMQAQAVFLDLPKTPENKDSWIPSISVASFLKEHGRAPDTLSLAEYKFYLYIYRARTQLQILANFPDDELAPPNNIYVDVQNAYKLIGEIRKSHVLDCPQWLELKDAVARQQIAMCRCLMAQIEYLTSSVVPREAMCLQFLSTCRFNFVGNDDVDTDNKEFLDDDQESPGPHPAGNERTAGLFYNNLALLHLKMRKPALASVYFQKSLQLQATEHPFLLPSERAWCQGASLEVRYNLGVTLLMLKHPFQAFRELKPLANAVRWPKLWLRIADCCMEMRKKFDLKTVVSPESATAKPDLQRIIKSIRGRGKARRFILVSDRDTGLPPSAEPASDMSAPETSGECLQFAAIALKNALIELEELKATYQFEEPHDERFKELHWLRLRTVEDAVLVKLSYCLLCQKDYAQALFYAREILVNHHILPVVETHGGENGFGTTGKKKNSAGSINAPVTENGKKDTNGSSWSVIPPERAAPGSVIGAANAGAVVDVKAVGVLRLVVMYAAECLMALNKVHDAKSLLSGVLNGHFFARGASKTHIVECKYLVDLTRKVKPPQASRKPPCTIEQLVTSGYDVSPWSILPMQAELSDNLGDQRLFSQEEVTTLIEAQAELYANLACLYAASGEPEKSEHLSAVANYIDVASAMNSKSVAALRTRLYLKLRAKKNADAMQLIKG